MKVLGVYEKIIMRIFAAWCMVTICMSFFDRDNVVNKEYADTVSMGMMLLIMAGIFFGVTLLDSVTKKWKYNYIIDAVFFVVTVVCFGINTMFERKDAYLSTMVIFGVLVCVLFVVNKYKNQIEAYNMTEKKMLAIICFFVAAVSMLMVMLTTLRCELYRTSTFDFGIFTQMFYNMKETLLPMTTCERNVLLSHFDVHMSPIYYLILPIYWLFPYDETLIIVQLAFIISGIIPLYLICKAKKLNNIIITAVSLVYILSPVLFGGLFYDFHENKFLTTLILWLLYFVEKEKIYGMALFTVLVLMVKEDAGIYVATIALYIIAVKGKKMKIAGAAMLALSVAWFFAAYNYLSTDGNGAMIGRYGNYLTNEEQGAVGIIVNIFKNPMYFFSQLLNADKLMNLLWVLVPLMFMPFKVKSIKGLILLIPFLVMNLMTSYVYQYNISHQYFYGSFALMLYLSVTNFGEEDDFDKRRIAICMMVASVIMFTSVVTEKWFYFEEYNNCKDRNDKIEEILDSIPVDASVCATTYYVPPLSHRGEVYKYPVEEECEYLVFDMRYEASRVEYQPAIDKYIEEGYKIIAEEKNAVIVLSK